MKARYGDVSVEVLQSRVAICEIQRGPNNFFDVELIRDLAEVMRDSEATDDVRAIVLCSQGKHFCAGNDFSKGSGTPRSADAPKPGSSPLYTEAVRLFRAETPVIAAVQGAAVGGGFGLAVMADFRVVCPNSRFTANFVKLGFHPGFGLTHTLPQVIGQQRANLMFFTGRRINGETAHEWGLGDIFTDNDNVRAAAVELAAEIAENAPLAVVSTRKTVRAGLADAVQAQTDHENIEQNWLNQTQDHREGVKAVAERRPGNFVGR